MVSNTTLRSVTTLPPPPPWKFVEVKKRNKFSALKSIIEVIEKSIISEGCKWENISLGKRMYECLQILNAELVVREFQKRHPPTYHEACSPSLCDLCELDRVSYILPSLIIPLKQTWQLWIIGIGLGKHVLILQDQPSSGENVRVAFWVRHDFSWDPTLNKSWICYFLPPATKLEQGYVFTGVCDSVHRGVCLSACWDTTPPAQSMLGDTVNALAVRILLECNLLY